MTKRQGTVDWGGGTVSGTIVVNIPYYMFFPKEIRANPNVSCEFGLMSSLKAHQLPQLYHSA